MEIDYNSVIQFFSFVLAVSVSFLLIFLGRLATHWNKIKRPIPMLVWCGIVFFYHAHYWASLWIVLKPHLHISFFQFLFQLLVPSTLAIITSVLTTLDFPNQENGKDELDLFEQFRQITVPFFSGCIVLLFVGQIAYSFLDEPDFARSILRMTGGVICILNIIAWKLKFDSYWFVTFTSFTAIVMFALFSAKTNL